MYDKLSWKNWFVSLVGWKMIMMMPREFCFWSLGSQFIILPRAKKTTTRNEMSGIHGLSKTLYKLSSLKKSWRTCWDPGWDLVYLAYLSLELFMLLHVVYKIYLYLCPCRLILLVWHWWMSFFQIWLVYNNNILWHPFFCQ